MSILKYKIIIKLLLLCLSILSLTRTNISNAIEFNDKFYGKMNVKVSLGTNFYSGALSNIIDNTSKEDIKNKVALNINGGVGFDVFYKANDLLHPFVGLDVNGGYTVLGQITKDVSFNQFFNANFRFGASFKVHKKVRINPYGFVGLNVSRFDSKAAGYNGAPISNEPISDELAYFYENWLSGKYLHGGEEDLKSGTAVQVVRGIAREALFKEKLQAYTNKAGFTGNSTVNVKNVNSIEEIKKEVQNFNENLLFKDGDDFLYYDIYPLNNKATNEYKDYLKGEYEKEINDGKSALSGGSNTQPQTNISSGNGGQPQTNIGLNAGVGVDFVFIDRIIVGLEYKYSEVKFSNYNLKAQTHNIGVKFGVQFL